MRIAQIADFHYTQLTYNPFRLLSKRLFAHLNWVFCRKKHFFETQVEPLPKLFEDLKVDWVLMGGDFSTTALLEEFEKAKSLVDQIKQPWIAIPGNHDRYTRKSCRELHFYRYFSMPHKTIEAPIDFFNLKDHRIEAKKMGSGWWVIALDTAIATNPWSSEGLFSHKLEKALEEVIKLIPKQDSIILLNHFPFFLNDIQRHNLIRGEALQSLLEKNPQIRLYLHGHTHRHTVADLQASQLPIVLDSGSCAQGRKGAWNLIDLDEKGCTVATYRWDHRWTKTRVEEFQWKR
ncbi:MAG: metallophosphoesterase [Verrucomicrobia bacterium]|nr:metallophosphoesterase [Verrucomicrobiota bacterium]MBU6446059.1 metallophosphoesterase [Verrucomicrobiota bacterium]MDE3047198.1 metallophosphoesterase [Verrucomicrobiota bacterium]